MGRRGVKKLHLSWNLKMSLGHRVAAMVLG